MMNSINDFRIKLTTYKSLIIKTSKDTDIQFELVEYLFFRLYTDFLTLLEKYFYVYSIGDLSFTGKCPNRKLMFSSETQICELILKRNDFFDEDLINRTSYHIFCDPNPFEILKVNNFNSDLSEMKILRNYIAHRSQQSKSKYMNHFFATSPDFFEPFQILLKKRKGKKELIIEYYFDVMESIISYIDSV